MNYHQTSPLQPRALGGERRRGWLGAIQRRLAAWWRICRSYYSAAAAYEELSRLSDAELERRGLDRSSLAKELCQEHERNSRE